MERRCTATSIRTAGEVEVYGCTGKTYRYARNGLTGEVATTSRARHPPPTTRHARSSPATVSASGQDRGRGHTQEKWENSEEREEERKKGSDYQVRALPRKLR